MPRPDGATRGQPSDARLAVHVANDRVEGKTGRVGDPGVDAYGVSTAPASVKSSRRVSPLPRGGTILAITVPDTDFAPMLLLSKMSMMF